MVDVSVHETPIFVEPAGAPTGTGKPLEAPLARYDVPTGMPSDTRLLRATVFELLIQTIVQRRMGNPASSKVLIPKGGSSSLGIPVGVAVCVRVAVAVGVTDAGILVGVFVGDAVSVAVEVGVGVSAEVGVAVGVLVKVGALVEV